MAQETWQDRAERRIKELGLARADLLKPLGVQTVGAVSHYFNGRRDPTPSQLVALARELKMTLDELLIGARHLVDEDLQAQCLEQVEKHLTAMKIPRTSKVWSAKYRSRLMAYEYRKAVARGGNVDGAELREQIKLFNKVA